MLRAWLTETRATPTDPLFVTTCGRPLSRYGIGAIIDRHIYTATESCPTLATKTVSAHTLRHYGNDWVMWPAGVFPLTGLPGVPIPAT